MRETAWPLFFIERSEGMRVLLLFDQIQAGYGGKERADTELGLEKGGIGSFLMFKVMRIIVSITVNFLQTLSFFCIIYLKKGDIK